MREHERLRRVYSAYDSDPAEQAKRNPANAGNAYELRVREATLGHMLELEGLLPLRDKRLLEIGCGYGYQLARMSRRGVPESQCYGLDILEDRITAARQLHPEMRFVCADARQMPYESAFFDLVLCFVMFSSILDDRVAAEVAKETDRVLKPGGVVIWYDNRFPNPQNPAVRAYDRAAVDRLFPGYGGHLVQVTLIPPLARRLGPLTSVLYPVLSAWPLLRVRLLGILRKPMWVRAPVGR